LELTGAVADDRIAALSEASKILGLEAKALKAQPELYSMQSIDSTARWDLPRSDGRNLGGPFFHARNLRPQRPARINRRGPIIRLLNALLLQAAKERASDIHIEPYEKELDVRLRIDGVLHKVLSPPKIIQDALISMIKIMSNLDIAEKRLPQDGRIRLLLGGRDIDIRVSVIPTSHGERAVLRLLDRKRDFGSLGGRVCKDDERKLEEHLRRPDGIILVTGPTGSGKTTTLYAALNRVHTEEKNIITVEDPIEYQLKGIGQIQVNPKIGLTFASGLRSILRQDPDIIMVGEIRDFDTAVIAMQASLTGHLVLSTLHTMMHRVPRQAHRYGH
jgi:general secretion pathway protein E